MNRISLCLNILILVYLNCDLYHARDMSSDEVRLKSDTIAVDKCIHYIERLRQKSPIPGLVVGVGRKGKPIWVEGFGQSDVENELKTRPDSIWRLASISKSLTSALVGHLIDKGLLSMNDTIDKYLSEEIFPTKTWNNTKVSITVSQLMSHTAGLRVTQFPNDFYEVRGYKNAIQSIAQFKDCPLISAPGSEWHYSNYGFQVLGAVIESVLKNTTYEQAINQMFAELGMKSTFAENQKRMIPHRARYYIRSDSDYLKNNSDLWNNRTISVMPALVADDIWSQNSWLTSAGIVSKAEDLIRFGTYMIASFKGNNSLDFGMFRLIFSGSQLRLAFFQPKVLQVLQNSQELWHRRKFMNLPFTL